MAKIISVSKAERIENLRYGKYEIRDPDYICSYTTEGEEKHKGHRIYFEDDGTSHGCHIKTLYCDDCGIEIAYYAEV